MGDRDLQMVYDEDDLNEFEKQVSDKKQRIDELNRVTAMFRSAGWKTVGNELLSQLNFANRKLIGDDLNTIEAVANVRGQMRALEWLVSMPNLYQQELELLRQDLKNLEAEVETG